MRKAVSRFISAADMSADITSNPIGLDQDFGYAIEAVYTTSTSLGGTFTLQASIDYNPGTPQSGGTANAGNWVTIDGSSTKIAGAGAFIWNVEIAMYPYVRLVYTHQAGDTGSLNAFYQTRGF